MRPLYFFVVALFILTSCSEKVKQGEKSPETQTEVQDLAVNLKSIEVEIKGMTCEIGCARTIQSKLSKFSGVTESSVSFESGNGHFTFDSNRISKEDIVEKISGIAGGDLYSVSKVTEIVEVPQIQ